MIAKLPGLPPSTLTKSPNPVGEVIRAYLPSFAPTTIFDVGANVGQSVRTFTAIFPGAAIYAFEPIDEMYRVLTATIAGLPQVQAFKLAFGRNPGHVSMIVDPRRPTESRVTTELPQSGERAEKVEMETGDRFCTKHSIEHIGFLKIDAEGYDLDVLTGFARMLSEGRIDLAEAEVSMNRMNTKHVAFETVKGYLESLGYSLFHIYEQVLDIGFSGLPVMRRSNVVFISPQVAERYARHSW